MDEFEQSLSESEEPESGNPSSAQQAEPSTHNVAGTPNAQTTAPDVITLRPRATPEKLQKLPPNMSFADYAASNLDVGRKIPVAVNVAQKAVALTLIAQDFDTLQTIRTSRSKIRPYALNFPICDRPVIGSMLLGSTATPKGGCLTIEAQALREHQPCETRQTSHDRHARRIMVHAFDIDTQKRCALIVDANAEIRYAQYMIDREWQGGSPMSFFDRDQPPNTPAITSDSDLHWDSPPIATKCATLEATDKNYR